MKLEDEEVKWKHGKKPVVTYLIITACGLSLTEECNETSQYRLLIPDSQGELHHRQTNLLYRITAKSVPDP
jgi:hypothetical protein